MTNFKPMLAAKAKPEKLTYPVYVQDKLDGIRCSIVGGRALTRTLKEVPNREIFEALSRPEFEGFDGELIVGSPVAPDCYRQTASFTMAPDKTGADWCFHVFDLWNDPARFDLRYSALQKRVIAWDYDQNIKANYLDTGRIKLSLTVVAQDARMLEEIEGAALANGHEGVILRDPRGLYKFGRSSVTSGELLKLKRFSDSEATIIGVVEEQHNGNEAVTNALGRTERSSIQANKTGKNTLGKFQCRDRYSGVEFGCGTGLSAAERKEFWEQRETLIGRVLKYKFFAVGVKTAPRHPVFLGLREAADLPDQDEAQACED